MEYPLKDFIIEDAILNNVVDDNFLMHYGVARRSGRYPYGSGKNPYQHSQDFLARVSELEKQGMTQTEIAKEFELSTTQLRTQLSLAKHERRETLVETAKTLRSKGYTLDEIAEKMGYKNDSSVRSLLNSDAEARMSQAEGTANFIKSQIDKKGMVDVGVGIEKELNISREMLNQALYMLELEGYPVYSGRIDQVTNPGKMTTLKVICPPGTKHKEIFDLENINSLNKYTSTDGGKTFDTYEYPASLDSKRIEVKYRENGGLEKDGLVEIRRGCKDLSLGNSHYAQVRVLVDGTHYIKGMAVYSDDLPPGVDVRFNTNKKQGTPICGPKDNTVLKNIKDKDPNNPFGALIKPNGQTHYIDKDGNRQLGLINKTREEGEWATWSDKLPSQFLAKQSRGLIKRQLDITKQGKMDEYAEICSLTNPTIKKKMLLSFSDDCDAAAVHLKAAALPGQKWHVILPCPGLTKNEVYAPNYKNGEKVALVRFPHGGTFEIPVLTVNNKKPLLQKMFGKHPPDALGINSEVAERLSGADFDGDTVLAIPTNYKTKITSTPPLKGLKDFDPKMEYPYKKGMKIMKNTQTEMGMISNLITDMTLKGANEAELARAVRHSMVVIDAEKHKLDYKKSYEENGISALQKKYQGRYDEHGKYHGKGASTLLSSAKGEVTIRKRKGSPKIDPETGDYIWKTDDVPYTDKKGNKKYRTQASTKMLEAKDAYSLSSGRDQENMYADYANSLKNLARAARKEYLNTKDIPYDPSARKVYAKEVNSLNNKVNEAQLNAPRERRAQIDANIQVQKHKKMDPDANAKDLKKTGQMALDNARVRYGAHKAYVNITDKEWEAIQAGAISPNKLKQILDNTKDESLKERAMPRSSNTLNEAKIRRIQLMKDSYSTSEIAEATGVSVTTVLKYLNE